MTTFISNKITELDSMNHLDLTEQICQLGTKHIGKAKKKLLIEQLADYKGSISGLRTFVSCVGGNQQQFNNGLLELLEMTTLMLGFE